MKPVACLAAIALGTGVALPATDLWELPPVNYSATPATGLLADLAAGKATLSGDTPTDLLRSLLDRLGIPPESQILVFSKTSKQNPLISPRNPRALFFNENAYVGYVPGGDIEVITHDPRLGPVFFLIEPAAGKQAPRIVRDSSECLSCHGTARTESVPGLLVRSVFPDSDGHPLLPLGTFLTDSASPIRERWGGYYVTGQSSLPHLGNRVYQEAGGRTFPATSPTLASVAGKTDTSRHLRPTSDIVALMVLEHQCRLHNELTAATLNYRRIHWLQKSLHPDADPDLTAAGSQADEAARRIVRLLLFENEAPLGPDGIEGDTTYQDAFRARFPQTKSGRSLADFQLHSRIFKHRCSYMIYSHAFQNLPSRVKSAVLTRLRHVLESEPAPDRFPEIKSSERRKILAILGETLPGWTDSR